MHVVSRRGDEGEGQSRVERGCTKESEQDRPRVPLHPCCHCHSAGCLPCVLTIHSPHPIPTCPSPPLTSLKLPTSIAFLELCYLFSHNVSDKEELLVFSPLCMQRSQGSERLTHLTGVSNG
ncbi:hypothetical protein HJG60_008171 [Phyllostomus discolor]|uniref:Uncharacterized protein n=1 Tax=Phyllostomus discolor TaxID=89673 RepID=A0A834DLW6_9CHIR|nr:hypothetical protein HJG60_008171 [Phyllostomus discolor]